jgi:hypothetical protein
MQRSGRNPRLIGSTNHIRNQEHRELFVSGLRAPSKVG